MFCNNFRSAALVASLLAVATFQAPSAMAYDIFEIYTDGPLGGSIKLNGNFIQPPDGACGIEWNNVEAWHWGPSAGVPVQSGFGGNLWYTVGYSTCADTNAQYSFVTPATPTGHPANTVLVVQADTGDATWLNWALDSIPGPELGPDHDFPSLCEMFPDFCEPVTDDFTIPDPCDLNPDNCLVNIAVLDLPLVIEITRGTAHELGHVIGPWGSSSPKGRTEIELALAEARRRLDNALLASRSLQATADELRLDAKETSEFLVSSAGTFAAATRFAVAALERAQNLAADLSSRSSQAEVEAVLTEIQGACQLFEAASVGARHGATFGGLPTTRSPNS